MRVLALTVCGVIAALVIVSMTITGHATEHPHHPLIKQQHDPESISTMQLIREDARNNPGKVWESLVDVGLMYQRGEYPCVRPDMDMARACLRTVALWCPDKGLVNHARARLFEGEIDPIDVRLTAPAPPLEIGDDLIRQALDNRGNDVQITTSPRSDAQNVHDHGVMSSVRAILESMPPPPRDGIPDQDIVRQVETWIEDGTLDISDDDRANALACLQSLCGNVTHSALGVSELESLRRVYHRLAKEGTARIRELFVKQLASCIEHGVPVCASGKIARIVATFDTPSKIKPLWVVKEEIASLASMIRAEHLGRASIADVVDYEHGRDTYLQHDMADALRERVTKEYIDRLGMCSDVIQPLIDTYAEAF